MVHTTCTCDNPLPTLTLPLSLSVPAKPIDVLAKYITSTEEEELDIEVQEPYLLLRGLNIVDLEDLLEDIKVYREIEMDVNGEFWSVRGHSFTFLCSCINV